MKEIILKIPDELYHEMQRAREAYALPDLAALTHQAVVDMLARWKQQAYHEELRKLRHQVQESGGTAAMGLGMTKDEIIANLRRTREQVFEEEYAHRPADAW